MPVPSNAEGGNKGISFAGCLRHELSLEAFHGDTPVAGTTGAMTLSPLPQTLM